MIPRVADGLRHHLVSDRIDHEAPDLLNGHRQFGAQGEFLLADSML